MLKLKRAGCHRCHLRSTVINRCSGRIEPHQTCQQRTQQNSNRYMHSPSLVDGQQKFRYSSVRLSRSHINYALQKSVNLLHRSTSTSAQSITIESLHSRTNELERTTTHRRLNKHDVDTEIWPLMTECATTFPSDTNDQCIAKAKLANRLLELCLREVDVYRVHLWELLKQNEPKGAIEADGANTSSPGMFKQMYNYVFPTGDTSINAPESESRDHNHFSPSTHWKNAPHPSKQMYNLAFSSWKNVIESTHSSKRLEVTEKAARQVSSLLSTMEDDYASDVEFVQAYNDAADRSKYVRLYVGAAVPDVTTYGEVMNAWGRCVGSFLRPDKNRKAAGDETFEHRLRLEASAIKAIMELKESMEDGLNQSLDEDGSNSEKAEVEDKTATSGHKRPPLDKPCYNIILATMARQINPSLAEMRLVIQEMMERVMHDLENSDHDFVEEDPDAHPSMECFPDVVSYNSLIEARASRSAMFASDLRILREQNNNDMFQSIVIPHHKWGQSTNQSNGPWKRQESLSEVKSTAQRSRKFTASEEEAIFAEQVLDEMCNLATVPVRPNIFSYNSVVKAWINTETDRGLQRAILILRALTMTKDFGDKRQEELSSSVLERLSDWSSKLLNKTVTIKAIDGELEIDYLAFEAESTHPKSPTNQQQIHFNMNPRMALMNAAMHGNNTSSQVRGSEKYEPIGPLPHIEPSVSPDLRTFKMILAALERHGTILAAKLSEDLVKLLEEHYMHLTPDASVYNLVLKGWMQASKEHDEKLALYAAKRTHHLLDEMHSRSGEADSLYPRPDESSFLMTINSYVNAASTLFSAGDHALAVHAVKQADELLQNMTSKHVQSRHIVVSCFGAVARAWADLSGSSKLQYKVSRADQAHSVLEKMVEISDGMHLELLPFNAVLDAWARELTTMPQLQNSKDIIDTLSKMHEFLMRMVGEHEQPYNVTPDRSSFNHMIRACYGPLESKNANVDDTTRRQILDLILDSYSQMNHSTYRPDAHTYLHLLKATNSLLPAYESNAAERFKLFKSLFEDCCEHGHLTKTTFWFVHKAFSKDSGFIEMLHSSTGIGKEQLSNMDADRLYKLVPSDWSRFGHRVKSLNKYQRGNKSKTKRW